LHLPTSFERLQELNQLITKYRSTYPYRILVCYVVVYLLYVVSHSLHSVTHLFSLQAFSLPGSMYLSILGGALWGVPRALPLVCILVATGATLCYAISAALGPALLALPRWKAMLERWEDKLSGDRANLFSFLILLRIAPLPPHWVVNVVAPHVGIDIVPFWGSTALGILGVSIIHTTIGGSLDEMSSAADFHLVSWKNFLTLAAIVVGVMLPVGLRYWLKEQPIALPDDDNK